MSPRWISEYDAQALVGAPITRPAVLRNYGSVDLGGGGTRVGNGDEPAIDSVLAGNNGNAGGMGGGGQPAADTTLYGNYFNPSFVGYNNYGYQGNNSNAAMFGYNREGYRGTNYASYGGFGYSGHPLGMTNYPPWLYRPRYFYPFRYYPIRTGFSVYNPYFYYNNTWYGRYANPFWSGYGGFAFPYHFGGYGAGGAYGGAGRMAGLGGGSGAGGAGYSFGAFGHPYRYGVFGYPYPGLFSSTYSYLPSQAYFMYPGLGGLYVPPGYVGYPGYYGYAGYGLPVNSLSRAGRFYW